VLELLGVSLELLDLGLVVNQALLRLAPNQCFDRSNGGLVGG
jgi:hypothetical protein